MHRAPIRSPDFRRPDTKITIAADGFLSFSVIDMLGVDPQRRDVQLAVESVNTTVNVNGNAEPFGVIQPPSVIDFGPAGVRRPIDAPYQANTISQEVIRSQNIRDIANFLEYDPSAQMTRSNTGGRPYTRGFESGVVENTRLDGMNIIITTGYPAEQFDRVEIVEGVAGALYGPANPTGTFDYI